MKFLSHPEALVLAIATGNAANARPAPAQLPRRGFCQALFGEGITKAPAGHRPAAA